jgi:hypothetical protein
MSHNSGLDILAHRAVQQNLARDVSPVVQALAARWTTPDALATTAFADKADRLPGSMVSDTPSTARKPASPTRKSSASL